MTATGARVPLPRRASSPRARIWTARTIVGDVRAATPGRTACSRRRRWRERLQGAGAAHAPVQDRHAAARATRAASISRQDGGAAGRRRRPVPFSFSTDAPAGKQGGVLPRPTPTRRRTRVIRDESGPQPHVQRHDRGRRPALLPEHRDEDRPLCRQAPAPAVRRADGAGHRKNCTSRACPPPCRRMCSSQCCTPSRGWSTRR